ncbi:MAG TPA: thiamine phosphate synthase, partial [Luteimonas sp.]|nr:thiamine phosphate synthase [Luteimonas sp.]
VPLVANDDVDAATDGRADGVHLGRDDGDVGQARRVLGGSALIGASCYGDLDRARRAAGEGASYLAFGAFHPSPTKPGATRVRPDVLQQARTLGLPLVAIGGITPANAPALIDAGADLIAVISGVFDAPDPPAAARAYRACFA